MINNIYNALLFSILNFIIVESLEIVSNTSTTSTDLDLKLKAIEGTK